MPNNGEIRKKVYQDFRTWKSPSLQVATALFSTLLTLDQTLWRQIATNNRKITSLQQYNNLDYPTSPKQKQMEQIANVYGKLIFPGQFLPHLFDEENAPQILRCGLHICEQPHPLEFYTKVSANSTAQHCRHYGMF